MRTILISAFILSGFQIFGQAKFANSSKLMQSGTFQMYLDDNDQISTQNFWTLGYSGSRSIFSGGAQLGRYGSEGNLDYHTNVVDGFIDIVLKRPNEKLPLGFSIGGIVRQFTIGGDDSELVDPFNVSLYDFGGSAKAFVRWEIVKDKLVFIPESKTYYTRIMVGAEGQETIFLTDWTISYALDLSAQYYLNNMISIYGGYNFRLNEHGRGYLYLGVALQHN